MKLRVVKTKKNAAPMQENHDYAFSQDVAREHALINLYPDIEYQEIKGFGGAFTEAAAETFYKASQKNREKILRLYFDPQKGIGYNLGRVHINSCDFSLGNYTYVEEGDTTLKSFDITRDKKAIIPMIQSAQTYNEIEFLASPWSPPAYMKTTGKMNKGGKLKKEYYELWAEYYAKFIKAYKACGIDVKAITVQNEPKATQDWDSCVYTAEEERDFVKYHLGKKMQDLGVSVFFWDHNKERVVERASVMLEDQQAAKYVHGLAFHWYSGDYFEELEMFHDRYPDKQLFFTEGCYEYGRGMIDGVKIGERYAHDIIGNFNHYCNAFFDWNLLLDEKGGPNHVGNYCDAPIMLDTKKDEIEVHASYYYIGHFSKFVKTGARRIGSSKWSKDIETVAFKNPDGEVVSVVLNSTDEDMPFAFRINGKIIECVAEAHSIATYRFQEIGE